MNTVRHGLILAVTAVVLSLVVLVATVIQIIYG